MQFFPGKDLDEMLDEKMLQTGEAFDVNQVLRWADQLLDALEYLHGHQPPIIHRDIKPQNLKLTEQGDVILLDFGLAKGAAAGMSQVDESVPAFTRKYAPLEQIEGAGTDPRSDLYSLAATIYQLITGQVPPDALTRAAAALGRRPDPLRPANKLNRRAPEAVAAAITRALAQLPDERPATATEMRRALRAAARPPATDYYAAARAVAPPHAPDHYATATSCAASRMEGAFPREDLATAGFSAAKYTVSNCDNAGWIDATSPALVVNEPGVAFARVRSGGARTVVLALCLLLLIVAALAYWRLNPLMGTSAADPSAGKNTIARPDEATLAPAPLVEVMQCYLEVDSKLGRVERVACDNPVIKGRFLKFHFMPSRSGYLYIIAPGEQGRRVTFLTAGPNSTWGVKGNLIEGGTEYSFPPRQDDWIEVARGASSRTYTVIFTPHPLGQSRFLAGPAGHDLTTTEDGELDELRKRFEQRARVEVQGDQSIVVVREEDASETPFLFDVNLHIVR
jgi:hypothetical protein